MSVPPSSSQPSATALFYRNIRWLRFVDRFGKKGQGTVEYVGGLFQLVGDAIVSEQWLEGDPAPLITVTGIPNR